jgi:hypothetical protein
MENEMNTRDNMGGKLTDDFGTITPPTAEQISLASRYVTNRAISDDDQRMLYSMLGLDAA